MTHEELKFILLFLPLIWIPFAYHGYRVIFDKAYFMRNIQQYYGQDVEAEYQKLDQFQRGVRRYRTGILTFAAAILYISIAIKISILKP